MTGRSDCSPLTTPPMTSRATLYLHIGHPRAAADSEQTPEGHVLRFDAAGKVIGLTIISAKWLLERDGELIVTLPEQVRVAPAAIEAAFATAA